MRTVGRKELTNSNNPEIIKLTEEIEKYKSEIEESNKTSEKKDKK